MTTATGDRKHATEEQQLKKASEAVKEESPKRKNTEASAENGENGGKKKRRKVNHACVYCRYVCSINRSTGINQSCRRALCFMLTPTTGALI